MKHFKLMKGVLACLLSLALVFSCFSTVGAQAEEAAAAKPTAVTSGVYVPADDTITGLPNGTVIYILKSATGNTIKKGTKPNAEADGNAIEVSSLAKSPAKDLYLYCCSAAYEDEAKSINANLIIYAQKAKKVEGVINYTKADDENATDVLSVKATDKSKAEIKDAAGIWYNEETSKWEATTTFTGKKLNALLTAGGTIKVKMLGEAGSKNYRTSKEIKVKVAKQGKAPKLALDVKKDALTIKNGMDFGIATKVGDEWKAPTEWFTVLPLLKTASTKTAEASIVSTSGEYLPLDKKATNATKGLTDGKISYTSYQYKNIALNTVLEKLGVLESYKQGEEVLIAVRTSATNKKPASAITYGTIKGQTQSPLVITEAKVDGQLVVSTCTDFDKKGFTGANVVKYPGQNGTTGFWNTFEVLESGSGADTNSGNFEYAIVKYGDVKQSESGENIDWATVSWKKLDAKTKITSKLATKYAAKGKTADKVALKAKSIAVPADSSEQAVLDSLMDEAAFEPATESNTIGLADSDSIIIVRRGGTKGKTVDDTTTSSAIIMLRVVKIGKTYYLLTEKSVGGVAKKYTVSFYKYSKASADAEYGYNLDAKTASIVGWATGTASVSGVELPEIEGADLEINTTATTGTSSSISGGKLDFTMLDNATNIGINIKEYANIKFVAEITEGTTTTTEELYTITNGKSSISGDKTTYYIGENIEIPSASGAPTSVSGYTIAIADNANTEAGYAKVADSKISTKVDSAKEVTVKVKYTKTAIEYAVKKSDSTTAVVAYTSGVSEANKATCKADIVFTVTNTTGKKVTAVAYTVDGGTASTLTKDSSDKYTIPKDKILGVIEITVTEESDQAQNP